jgi:iron complex outermembrane receptor protein
MKTINILLGTTAFFSLSTAALAADAQTVKGSEPQSTTDAAPAPQADAAQDGLQDIVVTAQRRTENLQRAAISITTANTDDLKRASVTEVAGLTALAPALQASKQGAFTIFYIRGVGGPSLNAYSESPVAYNLDGVYISRVNTINAEFFDLERIEVLKGPQGTLYGRNATAGAINVITQKPKLGEIGGYLSLEYGNFDKKLAEGALNIPLGTKTAARLAFQVIDRDGYFRDGTDDEKSKSVRLSVRSELTDAVTVTATGDYSHLGGRNGGAAVLIPGNATPTRGGLGDPAVTALFTGSPLNQIIFPGAITPFPQNQTYQDTDVYGLSVQIDADTALGKLTILPSYRKSHARNFATTYAFPLGDDTDQEQHSLEVRLASGDSGRLGYVLGAYYLKDTSDFKLLADSAFVGVTTQIGSTSTETGAGFGQLTFKVTDRLRLTGGARYTIERKKLAATGDNLPPAVFTGGLQVNPLQFTQTSPFDVTLAASRRFTATTYKFGVEFDAGPNSLLYASYGTGYKSGGFAIATTNNSYNPERVQSAVIGSKNRFLDNTLQINAEAFYQKYRDQQFSHLGFLNGNSGVLLGYPVENAGNSRIFGAEVEIQYRLVRNTLLGLQVQYLNTEYTQFTYTAPDLSIPLGLPAGTIASPSACKSTLAPGAYIVDCSGRPLLQSPEFVVSGGISQTVDIGNGGRVVIDLRSRFETSRQTSENYLSQTIAGSNTRTDLSATYHAPGDRFTFGAYVNNIENKDVVGSSFASPLYPLFGFATATIRPPRIYGLRAGLKF